MSAKGVRTERPVADVLDLVTRSARSEGIGEFEAFAVCKNSKALVIDSGRVSGSHSARATRLHVRVSVDGRVGGAFTNDYGPEGVLESLSQAMKTAQLMDPDRRWPGFPSCDGDYPSVAGIYDRSVADLDVDTLCSMAEEMIDGAMSVSRRVSVAYGAAESTEMTRGVCNSSGISAVMTETELHASLATISGSGSDVSPECENSGRSRDTDLQLDKIGEASGWVADMSTTLVDARTEECEVVFSPASLGHAEMGLLNIVLSRAFSGQNTRQEISFLADKVGEHIWSDAVTINDNPVLSKRCGSRMIDDEGLPTRKTRLARNGVVEGFLWDSYNGEISGQGTTGNAVRDLSSGMISPVPLCLQFSPGRGSMRSLIESVDHGYLVWACQGAHTSNTETGGYSFVASPGLLIEGGEVVGGVRGAMVSGNVSELLSNVERVGADVKDFGNALMPSALFKDVKVTTG
jgi:PmbA protein